MARTEEDILRRQGGTLTRPVFPEPQQFIAPQVDTGRISLLRQRAAAPEVRRLRQGLVRSLQAAQQRQNPAVSRLLTRSALSGFGEGLENVLRGAGEQAQAQYAPEFAAEQRGREFEFQAGERRALTEFEFELEEFRRQQESQQQEEAQRRLLTRRRPTRYVSSGFGIGSGGGGGGFASTSDALAHFTGAVTDGGGEPSVSKTFWPGGFQQQQKAIRFAERLGTSDLTSFFGDVDPEVAFLRQLSGGGGQTFQGIRGTQAPTGVPRGLPTRSVTQEEFLG